MEPLEIKRLLWATAAPLPRTGARSLCARRSVPAAASNVFRHRTVIPAWDDDMSGIPDITFATLEAPHRRASSATRFLHVKNASLAVVGHVGPQQRGDRISIPHALAALAALGQPTRLEIFRVLIAAEPDGLPAGALAERVGCPHNTLSSHLSILARSGLVRGARAGRSIVYRAQVDAIRALVEFLVNDCCGGHPELCDLRGAIGGASHGCAPGGHDSGRRTQP